MLAGEARVHLKYLDSGQTGYHSDNEDVFTTGFADDAGRRVNEPPQKDLILDTIPGSTVHGDFGSSHPGGMNACLVDGSVRVIQYTIEPNVFRNLGIINDGNVFTLD